MLASLATFPLVLLTGFFLILAGLMIIETGFHHGGEPALIMVNFMSSAIVSLFTNVFTPVANTIYNFIVPQKASKACPQGLLTLGNSAPICIDDMDELEAKRYTCPAD